MGTSSSKEAQALQSKLVDQVLQNLLSKDSSSNVTTQTNRRNHETHLYNNINISTARQDSSFQYPSMMMPLLPSTMSFFLSPSTVRCDAPPLPPPIMDSPAPPPPPSPKNDTSSSKDDTTNNTSSTTTQQQQLYMTKIPNPGPYESASYPSKRLTSLETQDGFRMDIQKQLSPYMVAIHSFWLGTNMLQDGRNKTYSFVTQVADENGLYMARLDPERGTIDGRIQRAILGGLAMAKLQFGVSAAGLGIGQSSSEGGAASEEGGGGGGSNDQLLGEVDFGGLTWTGNLKYGSMGGGIIFGFNYYQSITQRLAMGGEGMYIAANGSLLSSYIVKYEMDAKSGMEDQQNDSNSTTTAKDDIALAAANVESPSSSWFLAQLNPAHGTLNLHYKRVVTPQRVTLGAELSCAPMHSLESQVMFGAEFNFTRSKLGIAVDASTGRVQSVLETKLGMAPGSPSLNFSADVDHSKSSMRFGYGLNVGG